MGRIGGDDFDFVTDSRLARRLKRRRLDIRAFKINTCSHPLKINLEDQQLGDGMEDKEYMMYLNHLLEYSESRHSVREDGDDHDDSAEEDDLDPQYKMFLEKLREDGNSYVLEVAINNEASLSIKYEAQCGSDGECELVTLSKSRKVANTEKIEATKDLRNVPSKDKMETQKNPRNVTNKDMMDSAKNIRNFIGGEKRNLVVEKDLNSEPVNHVSGKTDGCSSEIPSPQSNHLFEVEPEHEMEADMVDECYQTVLDCIKVEGDCVGFTINGKSVKYEGSDVETFGSQVLVVEKDLNSEPVNHVLGETDGCSSEIPSPQSNPFFEVEPEHEMEADMVDECYQTFLDCIKVEGDCVGFTINGKSVKYEGSDVETFDSQVLVPYKASDFDEGNCNPFETSKLFDSFIKEDEQHCLGSPSTSKHYGFREMLMRKLRESYDHEEYEKLWQDINEQRPKKGRHRDLRGPGALKTYLENGCRSPSYLEQHYVLKRKINAVRFDRRKILNLLRGFFFWLQNLVREDAFPPWLDPSCLAVMPRNC